jgi:hypothetical protein
MESKRKNQVKVEVEEEVEGEDIRRSDSNVSETPKCSLSPTQSPPTHTEDKQSPKGVRGWMPTSESTNLVREVICRVEELFGQYPFTPVMVGDGRANTCKEELSSILRLLSVDEVVDIVRREYERARIESKGANLPRNLIYYMPAIKAAFAARDRELEEQERRREEEKRARERASPDNPVLLGEVLENSMPGPKGPKKALSEEEIVQRIKEIRTRIKGAGV